MPNHQLELFPPPPPAERKEPALSPADEDYQRRMRPILEASARAEREYPHLRSGDVRFLRHHGEIVCGKFQERLIESSGHINGMSGLPFGGTEYSPACIIIEHNSNWKQGSKEPRYGACYSIPVDRVIAKRDQRTGEFTPIAEWAAASTTEHHTHTPTAVQE